MTTPVRKPFRSERLVYRAVQTPGDNNLFQAITDDYIGYQNSNLSNNKLPNAKEAARLQHVVSEGLMGAVICLAPTTEEIAAGKLVRHGTAIGQVNLKTIGPAIAHHRLSEISIDILPAYQGKGYGSEAIRWTLDYAFRRTGLHKVKIRAFGWNTGAIRLYERLGFKLEGIHREELWHDGRWWDGYEWGMLDREWWDMESQKDIESR